MNFDYINRIGIFYSTHMWAEDVFRKICINIPRDAIQSVRNSRYDMKILLKDGSSITFLPANENIKGRVFDRVYYQDGISDEVVNVKIRPMWRPINPTLLEI